VTFAIAQLILNRCAGIFPSTGVNVRRNDGAGDTIGHRYAAKFERFLEHIRSVIYTMQQVAAAGYCSP